jgi:FMN phosphatase YigB (HAD superfamily)
MSISTLIFDWHGVLDHVEFEGLIAFIAGLAKNEPANIKQIIIDDAKAYTLGKVEPGLFWEAVQQKLSLSNNQLKQSRDFILDIRPNTDLWEKLPDLSKDYDLAILSDCSQDKVDVIRSRMDLSLFKQTFFSAEKHQVKAYPDFFNSLLSVLRREPEECLFIDDRQDQIERAAKIGLQTHLFSDASSLLMKTLR